MGKFRCCIAIVGFSIILSTDSLLAITLAPAVDFQTQGNSSSPSGGQSGGQTLNFRFINTPRSEHRFGMEFSLAGIPASHVVAGVTWRGTPTTVTGSSRLEFHGYSGNGMFSSSDTYNPANLLAEKVGITAGTEHSIPFDPGYLSTLLGTATHFGMYARERTDGASGLLASRLSATPPRLDVTLIDPLAPTSNRFLASGNQDWDVANNWSGGVPDAGDDVFIRPGVSGAVFTSAGVDVVNTMTIGGGPATAELNVSNSTTFVSNGITTIAAGGVLRLGDGAYQTGGLNTAPGGTIDWGANGVLAIESGYFSTPVGEFVVDGPGSPLLGMESARMRKINTTATAADRLILGNTGGGYMVIAEQSDVSVRILSLAIQANSRGNVWVHDAGTFLNVPGLFEIGPGGFGQATIDGQARLEGGLVFVGSTIQGAYDTNTVDLLTISDPGTTAKLGGLEANGKSIVEIKNGAVVEVSGIGGSGDDAQPPVLRVTGPGTRVTVTDRVQTGSTFLANGSSKMFVEAGARIDTNLFILGIGSATTGTSHSEFTITGPGSQVNTTGTVFFGGLRDAEASLDILDGGVLRAGAQTFMSATIGTVATARVSGAGSRWEQTGELHVGGVRDLNGILADLGPATFDIDAGGAVVATDAVNVMLRGELNLKGGRLESPILRHDRGGQFNFTGGTLVVDDFFGNLVQEGGTLAAGDSPGLTTIHGDYTLEPNAVLEVEIAAAGAPGIDFDKYDVTGFADLRGTLDVKLLDGFVPALGNSFAFLTGHAGFGGSFTALNLPPLPAGLAWQLNPGGITVFLNVVAAGLPGDFNSDGTVDAADYVFWRNGSGGDYPTWRANFGRTAGAAVEAIADLSSVASVPEPGSMALLILALFASGRMLYLNDRTRISPTARSCHAVAPQARPSCLPIAAARFSVLIWTAHS